MDWLDLEILAAHHTVNEIAEIKKCTPKTVRQALRNAGLKAKSPKDQLIEEIKELYIEKQMSSYEIAELLNRPRSTIDKWIHDAGFARSRRKAGKLTYRRWFLNTFVCHICHERKNLSELTQGTRFRQLFGCRECIAKNDCIFGRIIPPAQPGEKVPRSIPPPKVYILTPSGS